jgi:hypothetical protein
MKKVYLIILLIAVAFNTAFSQVPNAFNYQAVVRSSTGQILANKAVSFRISLLKNSETGTVVYSETHAFTTNEFGLVNFKIGEGTILSGSFSPVDWGEVIFIKVEFDPDGGSSYSHLATTKLSSVPFAIKAQSVVNDKVDDADADPANEIQTLSLNGTLLELSNGGGSVTLAASGESPWTESGDDIYRISGKIGIGTSTFEKHDKLFIDEGNLKVGRYGALVFGTATESLASIGMSGTIPDNLEIYNLNGGDIMFNTGGIGWSISRLEIKSDGDVRVFSSLEVLQDLNISGNVTMGEDVSMEQNLDVVNELTVGSIALSAGEIHKESTGNANMIPIAYGTINGNGTVLTSSGNITVTKAATGNYSIAINDENYSYGSYVTTATSVSLIGFIRTGSSGGKLIVLTYDASAVAKDSYFSFIVYKP